MKGIIFMESSGTVRERFRALGHDVRSCDLLPAEDGSPHHIQGDAIDVLRANPDLDFAGFHPTCQFLCGSGLHWNDRGRGWDETLKALGMVLWLMSHKEIPYYLENPIGLIGTMIRPPDQVIQPYEFGDDASKATCLWLNRLPRLLIDPAKRVPGRIVEWEGQKVERWANQTDSGQNRLTPSETRWKDRSRTYPGIAEAMAAQWGHETGTPMELAFSEFEDHP